jgi:hypothetical protein
MDIGGLGLSVSDIVLIFPVMGVWDPWARCWRIALQMSYCALAKRLRRSWGVDETFSQMTGMNSDLIRARLNRSSTFK